MAGLQDDLDRETERLATSTRERREEEDEQIAIEVRGATGSFPVQPTQLRCYVHTDLVVSNLMGAWVV